MKKILQFMRSMKFGILLLVLISAISLLGTIITQGKPEAFYLETYRAGQLILTLGLDHLFYTPYFLGLGILLILNLTLCSLVRFGSLLHVGENRLNAALKMESGQKISIAQCEKLENYLTKKHYRRDSEGGITVYYKNQIGHAGSFLVHLSLVLILLLGALVIYTGKSRVYTVNYDAPVTLEDGTTVSLVDFVTQDEEGNVHYESTLTITAPDGEQRTDHTSVNNPINFAGKKYFQDTYGYAAHLKIWNTATSVGDDVYLTEPVFLQTAENGAGLYYMAAYTDYRREADGQLALISDEIDVSKPAAFLVTTGDGTAEGTETGLVEEGTTLQVGEIQFTFEGLRAYPGILIKETSRVLMGFLYASFGLMIAGLWFCFFQQPVYISVGPRKEGDRYYHIGGLRNAEGLETELQLCMEDRR